MRKLFSIFLALLLLIIPVIPAVSVYASQPSEPDWEIAMNRGMSFIHKMVQPHPIFGFVGGEWAVLGLARGGYDVREGYFEDYLAHIASRFDALVITDDPNQVDAWAPNPGYGTNQVRGTAVLNPVTGRYEVRLMNQQSTENSRQILALAALGVDVTNFTSPHTGRTFDLVSRFGNRHSETDSRIWGELQGTNGPIWALIALDARGWDTPFEISDRDWVGGTTSGNAVTHNERIEWILARELYTGGWELGGMNRNQTPDPDMTAMAIQGLAPYYYRPEVRAAVGRALDWLSYNQLDNGGWRAWGTDNVQSAAQVVVALTALGYDPMTDPRFVKPGGNPVTTILRFFDEETGGFTHPLPPPYGNGEVNGMATEQATYALIAYWRFVNGMNPLYDMNDVFEDSPVTISDSVPTGPVGLPGRHVDINITLVILPNITSAPDTAVTRAEFATFIANGLGLPDRSDIAAEFTDIPANASFAGSVGSAVYYGIVSGTSNTLFNPSGAVTRQEAAVMIERAAGLSGMNTELTHVDIVNMLSLFGDSRAPAEWARSALAFCYRERILDDEAFYIQPLAEISRSEAAEMLQRMLRRANLL